MATSKRTRASEETFTDVHGQHWTPAKIESLLDDLYGKSRHRWKPRRDDRPRRDRKGQFKRKSLLTRLRGG